MRITPSRAYFQPGEAVALLTCFEQAASRILRVDIYHCGERISQQIVTADGTQARITVQVPAVARRAYLVHVQAEAEQAFTAFDVLDNWTQAPRYGFLYDFHSKRSAEDMAATMDHLLALHINGLQFYDWQYRHDTLMPPNEGEFVDPLGRALSLHTIRSLIALAHERQMAAMPYTAIYAASPPFAATHAAWQLYDEQGQPVDFADGFLKLMNPCSAWQDHFVAECCRVLESMPFDGIHVDQYGEPTTGFDADGQPVDLPAGFAKTLEALRQAMPQDKALAFNLVHNWPDKELSTTPLDFWYSELWPPDTRLARLSETVRANRQLNARPAVLAVYIPPQWESTVVAAQCAILAAGATQIAHGDGRRYLSDPYFPKAGMPSVALAERLQQLADFAVAYEEGLIFAPDVTETWLHRLTINDEPISADNVTVHAADNRLYINLLRKGGRWDEALPPALPRGDLRLSVQADGLEWAWCATPESPLPVTLSDLNHLPSFTDWLLIGLEFEEKRHHA